MFCSKLFIFQRLTGRRGAVFADIYFHVPKQYSSELMSSFLCKKKNIQMGYNMKYDRIYYWIVTFNV